MRRSYLLAVLIACGSEKSVDEQSQTENQTGEQQETAADETGETGETGDNTDTEDDELSLPDDLNGSIPEMELPVPIFTAMNSDDTTRNQDDLLGMATVMWFFPLAGTSG